MIKFRKQSWHQFLQNFEDIKWLGLDGYDKLQLSGADTERINERHSGRCAGRIIDYQF